MARFLITDYDFADVELELALFRQSGMDAVAAHCRTEDDVIAAARDCDGLLTQHDPVNARVFAAVPRVRIVSRFGAGFDTVNVEDAKKFGVWVANSPDYGIGEVAAHALAMALGLARHIPFYDRDVRAGRWHYTSAGALRRVSDMTLGILGLGRIGKRMAHLSQNVFGRILACDPYIAEGDFPRHVRRVAKEELFRDADVVSLHVPLNEETRGIANAGMLSLMK